MRLLPPKKNSVTVCLIVRDEAPYILEWIAHYQSFGVTDFIIYDNESHDDTTVLLEALAKSGVIQYFFTDETHETQRKAYADAVRHCKTEWIGFLDMDEFVQLYEHDSLPAFLGGLNPDVASVSLIWRSFGSNGKYLFSRQPVTTRYTTLGVDLSFGNMWCKYFVRVKGLVRPDIHYCDAKSGLRHVLPNGQDREFFLNHQLMPNYQVASLHHYPIKSHEEGLTKTKIRGQLEGGRLDKYNELYMLSHDVNDIEDLGLALRWAKVAAQLNELKELSGKKGWLELFEKHAPETPKVLARQRLWPVENASMETPGQQPTDANLECLLLSNESSVVPAITGVLLGLGHPSSVDGLGRPDQELHQHLVNGDSAQAAARASSLLEQGLTVLALCLPADWLEQEDLIGSLGLKPKRVIVLARDPLATAIKTPADKALEDQLSLFLSQYQAMIGLANSMQSPKLWISAEATLQNLGHLITQLANFFNVRLNPLSFQALKYRVGDDLGQRQAWNQDFNGNIDNLGNGKLTGWVGWTKDNSAGATGPVDVQVYVNNQPVAQLTANLPRPDLAGGKLADVGFELELPQWIQPGHTVRVLALNNTQEVNGSPAVYLG